MKIMLKEDEEFWGLLWIRFDGVVGLSSWDDNGEKMKCGYLILKGKSFFLWNNPDQKVEMYDDKDEAIKILQTQYNEEYYIVGGWIVSKRKDLNGSKM